MRPNIHEDKWKWLFFDMRTVGIIGRLITHNVYTTGDVGHYKPNL